MPHVGLWDVRGAHQADEKGHSPGPSHGRHSQFSKERNDTRDKTILKVRIRLTKKAIAQDQVTGVTHNLAKRGTESVQWTWT